jgi:hypothetical protein
MSHIGTGVEPADLKHDRDLFKLSNLFPSNTGLPMTVWAGPRGRLACDARINGCMRRGERMDLDDTAVVVLRPQPRLVRGAPPTADWLAVQAWVALNEAALLDYWDGATDAAGFVQRLRKI